MSSSAHATVLAAFRSGVARGGAFLLTAAALLVAGFWMGRFTAPAPPVEISAKPPESAEGQAAASSSPDEEAASATPAGEGEERRPDPLLLPATTELTAPLALRDGQLVAPEGDGRARIEIRETPLVVAARDVQFEDVDFVAARGAADCLLELQSSSVRFVRCTFTTEEATSSACAVAYTAAGKLDAARRLPTGRIGFQDCALRGLAAGVESHGGAVVLTADNLLSVASGPLLRLTDPPAVDEPCFFKLQNVTLREQPLLEVAYLRPPAQSGSVAIRAHRGVLAPAEDQAAVALLGPQPAGDLLNSLYWRGVDSLLASAAPFAQWRAADQAPVKLEDRGLRITGLSRTKIEFAGPPNGAAADSQPTKWTAPLEGDQPPGADTAALPPWPQLPPSPSSPQLQKAAVGEE